MRILNTLFKNEQTCLLFLFIVAFALRLTLFGTEFWRSPDSLEYINVAQNLIHGAGLTISIKWHFFNNAPVITSALRNRPLITSFIFAGLLAIYNSNYFLQAFLLLLGSVNILLFYFLARKFFSVKLAFLAAFLAALNPNVLITNRLVLSEPIFTFFVLSFFFLFFTEKKNIFSYIFLGILPALAYLTRFEGFFLLLLLPLIKQKNKKLLLVPFVAFIMCTLPYFIGNFLVNHSTFYSYNTYHFRVHNFSEGMWDGFGKTFPTSINFIKENFLWIVKTVFQLFIFDLKTLFGLGFLSFLSVGYLLLIKKLDQRYLPFLIFSILTIVLLSIIWAGYAEPERHFSTIYFLLLIPIVSLFKTTWKKVMVFLFILTFIFYVGLDAHRIYWARVTEPTLDNHGIENRKEIYDWINNNAKPDTIIANDNPWLMYVNTNRPSIIFSPNIETRGLLNKYITEYNVAYIISQSKLQTRKQIFQSNGIKIYCGTACKYF